MKKLLDESHETTRKPESWIKNFISLTKTKTNTNNTTIPPTETTPFVEFRIKDETIISAYISSSFILLLFNNPLPLFFLYSNAS
jgi:hypothetical protein